MSQSTSSILMIRPVAFRLNEQTATNNFYQKALEGLSHEQIQENALNEFDTFVDKLRNHGVEVIVVEDTSEPSTPDSIFPNNWVSFHEDGRVGIYPMFAENRRLERRNEILEILDEEYDFEVVETIDFSGYENQNLFLEGTGSMILDRENGIVYAAISERTDETILDDFCSKFGYKKVTFIANQSVDGKRLPIYHTNVMMSVGSDLAIVCAESIDKPEQRDLLINSLEQTGKEVILITEEQENQFAGNMLEVESQDGQKFMVMSKAAHNSLISSQIEAIEKYYPILSSPLDTIEALGGGSARCMMAEVFLPKSE